MRHALPELLIAALAAAAALPAGAQSQGEGGYAARLLDGRNDVGTHLATAPRPGGGSWQGFLYVADEQALFAGSCSTTCRPETRLTSDADRGRFVSAAARPLLPGARAIAAFYNATSGDLEALDCLDGSCNFATLRVLETGGDVGAGTAIAVDPASGLPLIAYYDATNADLRLYRCATNTCSSGSSVLVDGSGDRGRNPTLVVNAGTLTVAYDDSDSGEVRVATATAPYDTFTRTTVGSGGNASLSLTATGLADIVHSGPLLTLERRVCTTGACTAFTDPGTLSGIAGSGDAPSTIVLPNGNLFATHRDEATGDLLGTVCNNAACDNPQRLTLQAGPGMGSTSIALAFNDGRPLALFRDDVNAEVRSAQCTTAACTTILRRVAGNGIHASNPDVALRADGRAVAIWTRLREPRIALCSDATCSTFVTRTPDSGNSDSSRPSIVIRPDGRPFAFYSFFGGNVAWDCTDAQCSSGTLRQVGGTGNSTSNFTELAVRPDGRPVMLYTRVSTNEVLLFSCADVDCSTGTERLVFDEPTTQSTQLSGFTLVVGDDNRPRIAYNRNFQSSPGVFAGELRLARCDDVECTASTLRSLNAAQGFFPVPMAVRSDNRPVLVEAAGNDRNLLTCDDADCATASRVALPNPFDTIGTLALRSGNLPVFARGTIGVGGFWSCADPDCSAPESTVVISDATTQSRGFSGRLALDAAGQPVLAFGEQELGDVWLTLALPNEIFTDGFEP